MSTSEPKSPSGGRPPLTPLTPTRSRPNELTRIHTGQHPDDHSYYHNEADHESTSDETDEWEEVRHEDDERNLEDGIEVDREVRAGIANERDLEKNDKVLERKKSSRSAKDPNLVSTVPHLAISQPVILT